MSYSEKLLDEIQKHNFSNNNILLKKALQNDDNNLLIDLAENLLGFGFTDLAKTVYMHLIKTFPDEGVFKVYLAEILLNDGDEDQGLQLLYDIKPSGSGYIESLLAQADYYQTNGCFDVAEDKLKQALALRKDEPAIIFGCAEINYLKGSYDSAMQYYQELLDQGNKTFGEVAISQRIMSCLAKMGKYEEAAEVIQNNMDSLLNIDSQYDAGLIMMATSNWKQAIKLFQAVIDSQPDYVNVYPNLAKAYFNIGELNKALVVANAGISYNEYDISLYRIGSKAALSLKDYDQAQQILEKGVDILPNNDDLKLDLSNLYIITNQDKNNILLLSHDNDNQHDPQLIWNLAISYQRTENYQKAKEQFLLAYPNFKNNADFLRQLALFFHEIGDTHDFKLVLKKYIEMVPEDIEMQDLLTEL